MPSLDDGPGLGQERQPLMLGHPLELSDADRLKPTVRRVDRMIETAWVVLGRNRAARLHCRNPPSDRNGLKAAPFDRLPRVLPRGPGLAWLRSLFDNHRSPRDCKRWALKALKLERRKKLPQAVRCPSHLTMKEAVDTLLAKEDLQQDQTHHPAADAHHGLLARAEKTPINEQQPKTGVSEVCAVLRSMPDEAWRKQNRTSLVGRAYRLRSSGIAINLRRTDLATGIC